MRREAFKSIPITETEDDEMIRLAFWKIESVYTWFTLNQVTTIPFIHFSDPLIHHKSSYVCLDFSFDASYLFMYIV